MKDLFYDTDNRSGRGSLNFTYVEPLSANWVLSAQGAGFPQGYNEPYIRWDFSLTKNIKAWALRFSIDDILNQSRSTFHDVTANYVEDSMHNQTGR